DSLFNSFFGTDQFQFEQVNVPIPADTTISFGGYYWLASGDSPTDCHLELGVWEACPFNENEFVGAQRSFSIAPTTDRWTETAGTFRPPEAATCARVLVNCFEGTTPFTMRVDDTWVLPTPFADLSVSTAVDATRFGEGDMIDYVFTVSNAGPDAVSGARLSADVGGAMVGSWVCDPEPGAMCPAGGEGAIDASVDLPIGASVIFTLSATIEAALGELVVSRASVEAPVNGTDTDITNNLAVGIAFVSDIVFIDSFEAPPESPMSKAIATAMGKPMRPVTLTRTPDRIDHIRWSGRLERRISIRGKSGHWRPGPWEPLKDQ
ncbi:MAG: hypothetical protein AAGE01_24170, partial [Pseudomonadota bacterium]